MRVTSSRDDRDERMRVHRLGDRLREPLAIDRQRRAGRHAVRIGRAHHERAEPPHLLLQQADGVIELVAAEANCEQTSSASRSVLWTAVGRTGRISCSDDRHAARGRLPGGLAAGEPAADDVNLISCELAWPCDGSLAPAGSPRTGGLRPCRRPCTPAAAFARARGADAAPRGARPSRRAAASRRTARRRGAPRAARARLLERQRLGIRCPCGTDAFVVAVGHVRTVAAREQLERGAVVGQLDFRTPSSAPPAGGATASARAAAPAPRRDEMVNTSSSDSSDRNSSPCFTYGPKRPKFGDDRLAVVRMQRRARAAATAASAPPRA